MTEAPSVTADLYGGPELAQDAEWQRLDPRMLLVHPIRELIKFLPALLAVAVAGASGAGQLWQLLAVAVPIGLGVLRYLTTRFRISAGRIEVRRGLLNRHKLSTPIERVRTVDLTSSLIHRVLGLTTIRIGTGSVSKDHDEQLDLDGLPVRRARELRRELLVAGGDTRTAGQAASGQAASGQAAETSMGAADVDAGAASASDQEVARLHLSWLRFAPFTGSGLVLAAAAFGVLTQSLSALGLLDRIDPQTVADRSESISPAALIAGLVVLGVVVVSVLAVGGYLVTDWGFRLTRRQANPARAGDTWHLTRGLLTTRETTLDDARVAGVTVVEPIGLRLVRGARLLAIVTGLDRRQRSSSALMPPAPREAVLHVAAEVLDTDTPLTVELVGHGSRAVRRRWTRALTPALVLAAGCVVGTVAGAGSWLLVGLLAVPVAALLAADRSRALGHALVPPYLVARSGSIVRRRRILEVDHIIGWTFRASWFQRRAGLTTLVATTAGGPQAIAVLDLPGPLAVALAADALPDLVDQFRQSTPTDRRVGVTAHR